MPKSSYHNTRILDKREKNPKITPPKKQKDRMQPNIEVICNRKVGGGVRDGL